MTAIPEAHDRLRGRAREREGREAELTAGSIYAQSVARRNKHEHGFSFPLTAERPQS